MLIDPRNGPDYDTSDSADPVRWWFVASTPRTGSTLLARALWQTQRVGAPKEYINPTQLRDWEVRLGSPTSRLRHLAMRGKAVGLAGRGLWTPHRRLAHLERVGRLRHGPTGWAGLKVHHHHYASWFGSGLPPASVRPQHWVRVHRN
ncbi:MAG: Stf0 family sulfotransferase, partial [Myxococcota bacterium]